MSTLLQPSGTLPPDEPYLFLEFSLALRISSIIVAVPREQSSRRTPCSRWRRLRCRRWSKAGLQFLVEAVLASRRAIPTNDSSKKGRRSPPAGRSVFAADVLLQVPSRRANPRPGRPICRAIGKVDHRVVDPRAARNRRPTWPRSGVMLFSLELLPVLPGAEHGRPFVAGHDCRYRAVLVAAEAMPKIFPMLSRPPAR